MISKIDRPHLLKNTTNQSTHARRGYERLYLYIDKDLIVLSLALAESNSKRIAAQQVLLRQAIVVEEAYCFRRHEIIY